MAKTTPAVLANNILRYPERLLLDVPQFIASVPDEEKYKFLLDTERELGRIGKLQMRRQFILCFAEVVKEPSKSNVKALTNFLFNVAPKEFREALLCEGKCQGALDFLKLLANLLESLESGRKPQQKGQKDLKKLEEKKENVLKELEGADRDVTKEWYHLLRALCKIVAPKVAGKKKRSELGIEPPSPGKLPPSSLRNPDKAPHLLFIQGLAKEVYIECLEAFYGIHVQ
jgi:hypothetical protein